MTKKQSTAALPKARKTRLVVREVDSESLIYDLESHKATCLNAFSAQVWRLCDGSRTVHDITEALAQPDSAEGAVALTLKKLAKADLLTGPLPGGPPAPRDHTRRAVIHGALAASAGIAAVTTLTIPEAAQAVSCLPNGSACSDDPQCCSGFCSSDVFDPGCKTSPV